MYLQVALLSEVDNTEIKFNPPPTHTQKKLCKNVSLLYGQFGGEPKSQL